MGRQSDVSRTSVTATFKSIDPIESFGIVDGISYDVPDRNVTFAVCRMCVWHSHHHFLLNCIVVVEGFCFVCWY